jgi:hypothetical protein
MPILGIFAAQNYSRGLSVDYLVVAGGGAGGNNNNSGGGGAGGLRSTVTATGGGGTLETPLTLALNTSYTVTVGAGGAGQARSDGSTVGASGSNSVFATITSTGGGGGSGGDVNLNGGNGGSGGGASYNSTTGGTATANQGFNGGGGANGAPRFQGNGGGGAGAAGNTGTVGNGGNGVATSISGSSVTYAGGGGGATQATEANSSGGTGGGGRGAGLSGAAVSGTVNTGSGGGGTGNSAGGPSGSGGSGIVIARYSGTTQKAYGGTVTTSGGNTIHTFNSSGIFYTGTTVPVTGYSLWLDANDASTFTFSSGSIVSEWRDKSGNGYHFSQATGALQPERQSAQQNGLPSVYFSSDALENSSWDWSASAFTFFIVVKNRTGTSYDGFLSRNQDASLQLGTDNANYYAISRLGQATSASNLSGTGSNADVVVYKSSGISSGNISVNLWRNNTAASSAVTLSSLVAGNKNVLGATRDSGSDPTVGYISEVLLYPSQLSDSNRNSVENYLKAKWGTA